VYLLVELTMKEGLSFSFWQDKLCLHTNEN
jgi:hypothetical protein